MNEEISKEIEVNSLDELLSFKKEHEKLGYNILQYDEPTKYIKGFIASKTINEIEEVNFCSYKTNGNVTVEEIKCSLNDFLTNLILKVHDFSFVKADSPKDLKIGFAVLKNKHSEYYTIKIIDLKKRFLRELTAKEILLLNYFWGFKIKK